MGVGSVLGQSRILRFCIVNVLSRPFTAKDSYEIILPSEEFQVTLRIDPSLFSFQNADEIVEKENKPASPPYVASLKE